MADDSFQEKTEEASPRRRQEAAEKGQFPRSQELSSALLLIGGSLIFALTATSMGMAMEGIFYESVRWMVPSPDFGIEDAARMLAEIGAATIRMLAPLLLGLSVVSLLVGAAQARGTIKKDALEPKASNINPVEGFKKIFGWKAVINLVKQVLKISIIGTVAYLVLANRWDEIMGMLGTEPAGTVAYVRSVAFLLLGFSGGAFLIVAAVDYAYQVWDFEKNLRMSKQEIKDEMKQTDGDPQMKGRIRSAMIDRVKQLAEVAKADVVVVNPTHRAIALRYDGTKHVAPFVIAMGEGDFADKIRTIAEHNKVPIVRNKPLAIALLATAKVGKIIPQDLWAAVAEVLNFVYNTRMGLPDPNADKFR